MSFFDDIPKRMLGALVERLPTEIETVRGLAERAKAGEIAASRQLELMETEIAERLGPGFARAFRRTIFEPGGDCVPAGAVVWVLCHACAQAGIRFPTA